MSLTALHGPGSAEAVTSPARGQECWLALLLGHATSSNPCGPLNVRAHPWLTAHLLSLLLKASSWTYDCQEPSQGMSTCVPETFSGAVPDPL